MKTYLRLRIELVEQIKAWFMRFLRGFLILAVLMLFYLVFVNYTEPTEIGIARNFVTGKMWCQTNAGWHLTSPVTRVAKIDTRPRRVVVSSAGHGYSAKLVQFDPQGWEEFVATEGFSYYWWYNRFSFNGGYHEEHRGMADILRGYAYSAKRYSFIKVLEEYTMP